MFKTDPTEKVYQYIAFDDEGYDDEEANEQEDQSEENGDLDFNRGTGSKVRIAYPSREAGRARRVPRL